MTATLTAPTTTCGYCHGEGLELTTGGPSPLPCPDCGARNTDTAARAERTFDVAEANLDTARELVAKVNRKAARYGLAGYELVVGEARQEPITSPCPLFGAAEGTVVVTGYRTVHTVELTGDMPQIDGWAFVATLDYEESAPITRPVPGVELDLSAHRVRENECDHCHTNRRRAATYVLANAAGDTMQVGSTCIQPYMGLSVRGLAWLAGDPLADLADLDTDREEAGYSYRSSNRLDTEALLVTTMATEQLEGWVSRQVAEEYGKTATAALVLEYLGTGTYKAANEWRARLNHGADWTAARAKADAVRAWALAQDGTSEWAHNLRTLAAQDSVGYRNAALLCSAVAGYNRETADRVTREARVAPVHVGTVGKRQQFTGEVVMTRVLPDYGYGPSELVLIRTTDGGLLKWKASNVTDLAVGDTVTGKATVKAHEEYRGDAQTVIQRPAFTRA